MVQRKRVQELSSIPDRDMAAPIDVWAKQWAAVPDHWRAPIYRLDGAPHREVFTRNPKYNDSERWMDFTPTGSPRLADELAWWVHTCWLEGHRKIEPSMLRWWSAAVGSLAATRLGLTGRVIDTITDLTPAAVVREGVRLFQSRNNRFPSAGNRRNLEGTAEHIHMLVNARCTNLPWWAHDQWNLTVDPRIPRREHEPSAVSTIRFGTVRPLWLREGLRFWLRTALTYEVYTWTTAVTRMNTVGSYLARYCADHGLSHPAVTTDPDQLRLIFMDLLGWLRSPAAATNKDLLSKVVVNATQSQIQAFYEFMFDHQADAAAATGDPRWLELTERHCRLWSPTYRSRRSGLGPRIDQAKWIATEDLQRMLCVLPILGAQTSAQTTVTMPDDSTVTAAGLGDEQAMRVWLIQAMTGRRASEILMLDFDPITALTQKPSPEPADDSTFVARLRYQQTKVDGVDPTILVEQGVVNVVREQQRWVKEQFPDAAGKYLFLNPSHNHRGLNARAYRSYLDALKRFDKVVQLTTAAGESLHFTNTHRLRHTRATELLNAGVAQHIVQRYLGHRSPEMTMHYAQTLAATAEAEFLRYKKIGADGRDIGIAPKDIYEMTQLDRRTDRILPNGVCLLPPTKSCDKGNACLPCGHFATDRTNLVELQEQRRRTLTLIDVRQSQHYLRTGTQMTPENIWMTGRRRELNSLDAIIDRLESEDTDSVVAGAGTAGRTPDTIRIDTDGAHHAALDASRTFIGQDTST